MLKRINWKAVFYAFAWIISLGGLVVLMSFISTEKSTLLCKDVKVYIPGSNNFIERTEVDRILTNNGRSLLGKELRKINIQRLEDDLKANPFIEFAKVYADMNGIIRVQIRQREPIIRIFNMGNQDFYIDKNGYKIPISDNFTANVPVANGFIQEVFSGRVDTLRSKLAKDLFQTAKFIEKDTLWRHQIEQLYVNSVGEIELTPRVGDQKIILGNADSLQVKFENLYFFYKNALPKVGWDAYKTINIKFTNQVIGEKNPLTAKTAGAENSRQSAQDKQSADSLKERIQDIIKN
ncbi:MAG TPA: cell division protein FtsQ [Daejeonella sp.]|nr:cell division protein FtsQ [Daejeonella sp.]